MKILMVCLGNFCRSPLAEGIMRHKIEEAGLNWQVDSAGTNHYETGCAPHHLSQNIAGQYGIDICNQQCRQFTAQDIINFDKIYVMDKNNYNDVKSISHQFWDESKVDLLLNELYPDENRIVPDPFCSGEKDYKTVYELIDKACEMIIEKYRESVPAY